LIKVYFKKYFYSDVLVGSFKTDFGTIYRHPGHEVFHKWGELAARNERKLNSDPNLSSDNFNYSSYESEFSLKGYVKFDIVLQSRGDQTKLHYEETLNDDNDDIEKYLRYYIKFSFILMIIFNNLKQSFTSLRFK
jgi:hypothetical protein